MVTRPVVSAKIEYVQWAGLRCRVKVTGDFDGCTVDSARQAPPIPTTSLDRAKAVGQDGTVALVVADDRREGSATTLVLLDPAGNVLEKMPVTVGG